MTISEDDLLGVGGTKKVYLHPNDNAACIKFPRTEHKKRSKVDLLREIKYLKRHQDRLGFVSKYLGTIKTNYGLGYVYERAVNQDGSSAMILPEFLKEDPDRAVLHDSVEEMYKQLMAEHAVACDLQLNNFFIKDAKSADYSLCLVDGFGNSDFIKVCDYSKYFLKKKLARKFNILCKTLKIPNGFIQ